MAAGGRNKKDSNAVSAEETIRATGGDVPSVSSQAGSGRAALVTCAGRELGCPTSTISILCFQGNPGFNSLHNDIIWLKRACMIV